MMKCGMLHSLIIKREGHNTVSPSLRRGIDFLFHPFGWINDEDEENVCTPPKLGRYLEIYPSRP